MKLVLSKLLAMFYTDDLHLFISSSISWPQDYQCLNAIVEEIDRDAYMSSGAAEGLQASSKVLTCLSFYDLTQFLVFLLATEHRSVLLRLFKRLN
jgi:hypothetical protein